MPVRPARPSDFDDICALLLDHAAHEGASELIRLDRAAMFDILFAAEPVGRALVAAPDDDPETVAGVALWYPTFSTWAGKRGIWLEDLFVRPEYRRNGFGRRLLEALRSMTEGRVEWDVADENAGAEAFYRSLGARPAGGWTRYRWVADLAADPGAFR